MKNQKGFTLIELLLVLAIIGIISAIAIPALLGQRENARNRATASNASNIAGALQTALGICEDNEPASRGVTDLESLAAADTLTATTVRDTIIARDEFQDMKQPFTGSTLRGGGAGAYISGEPAIGGDVGTIPEAYQGQTIVRISYITKLKGTDQASTRLAKNPETSMAM